MNNEELEQEVKVLREALSHLIVCLSVELGTTVTQRLINDINRKPPTNSP